MPISPEVMAIAGAVGGAVAGWVASALTVVNRVAAIEATLTRIETRMDAMARGA